ncbi:PLP-dependent aminotransferase family protein [Flagellimonas aquimarina]|uniref:MocR-like pyridoxine biosynthesis transcription factor PdxR n=1 Tax=Flagellimonas aquimarina TaxID=2201895 RepID=UPI001403C5AF|nr:PLP-dependent aminotransferase family protein [Allomuricauda koreensis]
MKTKLNSLLISHGFSSDNGERSLYMKLSNSFMRAINKKKLVKGYQLPPTRLLAKDMGLSRSTVIKAYEILCLENYIYAVQGSGYYVNDIKDKKIKYSLRTQKQITKYPEVSERAEHFSSNITLMNRGHNKGIAFRPGLPPLDVFPVRQWQNLTNNYWRDIKYSDMSYSHTLGLDCLRRNIADYLKMYRNIQCDYSQIIIVTGSLHSLSIIGDLLLNKKDEVVVENPTYANALAVFKSLKAKIVPAEIDSEGLSLDSLSHVKLKKGKLIFTTPSNQYPTGVQMSLKRRLELLDWAQENNMIIVEDDYDNEFSNWESPITSIFGLDKGNRVFYQGTFNKILHPSIRLGYLIAPPHYVDSIKAMFEQSLRFISPVTQRVMSDFIEKDYLNQHLRKVVQVVNERKQFFVEHFKNVFDDSVKIQPANQGLHLMAKLPDDMCDIEVSKMLIDKEIISFPYSKYFIKTKKEKGLVMGFSSVSTPVIKQKLEKMARAYTLYKCKNDQT